MKSKKLEETNLIDELRDLGAEAPRDSQKAADNRAAFISSAWKIRQTVSKAGVERHNVRRSLFAPITLKPRREGLSMMNVALTVMIVLGFVFGGGGITVSAAQSSMPDDALYALKLASEQVRMKMAGDAEAEFQLALQYANRRMEEAMYVLGNGEVPDEALMNRIQLQNENCLRLAVSLPDDQVAPALAMLQEQFRLQLQMLEQANMPDDAGVEAIRLRLRTTLELQLQLAQMGEGDQLKLKEQLQLMEQQRLEQQENDALRKEQQNQYQNQGGDSESNGANGNQWQGESATQGSGDGSGESQNPWTTDTPTPGSGYGPGESQNPWTTETPTPGSGYGPGESENPWTTETPTPGSGYGPGESENPWTTGTPTSGSGYGPGSGECLTCTPQGGTPGGSGGSQP